MDVDRLLDFASTAGKIMLQSGAEIYRVEETICIICNSFDLHNVECFASTTAVIVSIIYNGKIHTIVKRISTRGIDLNKVHAVNSLSRKISLEKPSIDYCENILEQISKDNSYSLINKLFFAGIATSTFTVLFGSNLNEFICAFFIGILIKFIETMLNKTGINNFFINGLCGAIITLSSILFLKLNLIQEIDKIIAGSIMLLVPGLLLTNSIRDILEGQLVSGLTKAAEALFIGVSTAVGAYSVLHFFIGLGGVI
ncbi:MAG: threonine/serine exporter family protein [Clostridium sp.]|nr:threonine/serine exporter family protein [Clostridium sp.]